ARGSRTNALSRVASRVGLCPLMKSPRLCRGIFTSIKISKYFILFLNFYSLKLIMKKEAQERYWSDLE
ncbi:MAG: hypothetical protein KHZ13_11795, partial [Firmicutes bacterium]|nr:hypothetical protein [Bacillota bacterium]